MTEPELFARLAARPGLRRHIARTPEESQQALREYRTLYFGDAEGGLIRTADVRSELLSLLSEVEATGWSDGAPIRSLEIEWSEPEQPKKKGESS